MLPTHAVDPGFDWEATLLEKLPMSAGDPVVGCARVCEQEPDCVGFALEPSAAATTCFTVNSTRYAVTRLADCPSYEYIRDPACKPTCGGGSDGLRLPAMPAASLYQPRPAVSAAAGGAQQCAALCDRLPGCVGFSISNTTEALCFPANTTSPTTADMPVLSYTRVVQNPAARAVTWARSGGGGGGGSGGKCLAILRGLCPAAVAGCGLSLAACRACMGHSQHQLQERAVAASCTAHDVARYCATSLEWWVAPPTDHVFEDDLPTMSQYCGKEGNRRSIQWSAVAGGTVASQLALRLPSAASCQGRPEAVTVAFDIGDLLLTGPGAGAGAGNIPAASMSVRQLGSVLAPTAEYPSERGAAFYPDILVPIYQPSAQHSGSESVFKFLYSGKQNGRNGRRLSWEGGSGRQISNQRVSHGGGPAGVHQCQKICEGEPTCNGFFLGAAGDCHTVNATNVAVATSLEGVSYRRQRTGLPLVPNVTRSIWLDMTVPFTAAPGVYTGSVAVKQLGQAASVPVFQKFGSDSFSRPRFQAYGK